MRYTLLILSLLITTSVQAENSYVGFSTGNVQSTTILPSNLSINSPTTTKIFAGSRNKKSGVEMSYSTFGEFILMDQNEVIVTTNFTVMEFSGIMFMNWGRLEPFAKVGLVKWSEEAVVRGVNRTDGGTDLMVGIGAQYKISNLISFRLEVQGVGGEAQIDIASMGLVINL